VIGLATALAARDRGAVVTVLEADAPGAAQSTGPGRIFRHIHDLDELVPLAVASRRGWEEAGERFGRPFLDGRGTLLIGGARDRHARALADAGVAHEPLDAEDLPPALAPLGPGLLDPGGGAIDAEAYVGALAAELADSIEFARAREVLDEAEGVAVVTDHRRIEAGAAPMRRPMRAAAITFSRLWAPGNAIVETGTILSGAPSRTTTQPSSRKAPRAGRRLRLKP
jgi:glycine/D-amino acid oxidase-like deaminating enzyme